MKALQIWEKNPELPWFWQIKKLLEKLWLWARYLPKKINYENVDRNILTMENISSEPGYLDLGKAE